MTNSRSPSVLQKEPGLESRSGPHGELHQDRPMGSSPFSQTAVTAQMQSQASGTTGHSLPPKGSGTEKSSRWVPRICNHALLSCWVEAGLSFGLVIRAQRTLLPWVAVNLRLRQENRNMMKRKRVNRTRMANPADWEGPLGIQELSLEIPHDTRGPLSGSASTNFTIPDENTDIHN